MTQAALAKAIGMKQPQVARLEHGQVPTLATLALQARALGAEFIIGASGLEARRTENSAERSG